MRYTVSLKGNQNFRMLYRSRKCYVCPHFVVYCRKNRLGRNRLGLTAGAKLGGAVRRNRARRRLRELYRLYEKMLPLSYDFVIVARSKGIDAPFSALQKSFDAALRSLDLKKNGPHPHMESNPSAREKEDGEK